MSIGSTAQDYLQALINLMPTGAAFPQDAPTSWQILLDAFAQTFARVDANAVLLMNEAFPDTTQQLLPNWERIAGLPDACFSTNDTYAVRRLNLIAKLTAQGGQSKAYFIALALSLGYTITINELRPFQCGISACNQYLTSDTGFWFVWQVIAPLNSVIPFKTGVSGCGDALRTWGNTRLECLIQKYAPAQTIVQFVYQ